MTKILAGVLIVLVAACGYFIYEMRRLSSELEVAQKELTATRESLQKKEQELSAIAEEKKKKSEQEENERKYEARLMPAQFGYYALEIAADEPTLRRLQPLLDEKSELPLDPSRYLDQPQLIFKTQFIHFVFYRRDFSMFAPTQVFFHIVAKVKGEDGWVVRDRGYNVQVSALRDNRDMIQLAGC